jgi:hypothetical protein
MIPTTTIVCGQCGSTVSAGMGHSCWNTLKAVEAPTNVWPPKITATPPRPDLGEEVAKLRSDVTILKGMVSHQTDLIRELLNLEARVEALIPKIERIERNVAPPMTATEAALIREMGRH